MDVSYEAIGWCRLEDGEPRILLSNGFTMDGENMEDFIRLLSKEVKKNGLKFPEFYKDGDGWKEVTKGDNDAELG